MHDTMILLISISISLLFVSLGFVLGGLLPAIIKGARRSDIEVMTYLKQKADAQGEVEGAALENTSASLEKKLYHLELSMACILGERLEAEHKSFKKGEL